MEVGKTPARYGGEEEEEKVLAFDVETRMLASEVEKVYAAELEGESPWSHPEMFGFGCGVIVDVASGVAYRYREGGAKAMIEHLEETDMTVGYTTPTPSICVCFLPTATCPLSGRSTST